MILHIPISRQEFKTIFGYDSIFLAMSKETFKKYMEQKDENSRQIRKGSIALSVKLKDMKVAKEKR